jgi:glycosyltransferase 2 family protein
MTSKRKIIQWLTWPLALGLAALVLVKLPLAAIVTTVSQLSVAEWMAWLAFNVAIIYLYVWRWRVLLQPLAVNVSLNQLLTIRQAGQAVSFITPGPQFGGEPLQIYWLWKKFAVAGPVACLAVAIDRFYELWINFAILLLGLLILLGNPVLDYSSSLKLLAAMIVALAGLSLLGWALMARGHLVAGQLKKLAARWQERSRLLAFDVHWSTFSARLEHLVTNNRRALCLAFVLSLLGWLGMLLELVLILGFAGIELDVQEFVFFLVVMRLAFLLPLPGGIGTVEAAIYWVFVSISLDLTAAAAVIALMRLRDLANLGFGMLALLALGGRPKSS